MLPQGQHETGDATEKVTEEVAAFDTSVSKPKPKPKSKSTPDPKSMTPAPVDPQRLAQIESEARALRDDIRQSIVGQFIQRYTTPHGTSKWHYMTTTVSLEVWTSLFPFEPNKRTGLPLQEFNIPLETFEEAVGRIGYTDDDMYTFVLTGSTVHINWVASPPKLQLSGKYGNYSARHPLPPNAEFYIPELGSEALPFPSKW